GPHRSGPAVVVPRPRCWADLAEVRRPAVSRQGVPPLLRCETGTSASLRQGAERPPRTGGDAVPMVVVEADSPLRSSFEATRGEADRAMSPTGEGGSERGTSEVTLADRAALALESYRAGVVGPLDDLVVAVTPLLWRVVRAQNVPREAAEDVVQGVWLTF